MKKVLTRWFGAREEGGVPAVPPCRAALTAARPRPARYVSLPYLRRSQEDGHK